MNDLHRAIREQIRNMAPKNATEYIKGFDLPEDEERYLIECDIRGRSYIQVSMEYHISPECIKKKRQKAYIKIADGIKRRRVG